MSSNNSALRQLALESQQRFSEKRLQDALSLIQQCSSIQNKELDSRNALKLQHNLSLLQYMVGSQAVTDETGNTQDAPRRLLEELVRMRKVIEDKLSQQETDNATNSVESTPPSPSRNLFEDADLHVVSLNQAALLMHLKQFGSALIILESMFQNIEPLDEALVLRVCWMLLELYVGPLHSPEKAVPVFTFVEKNFADRIKHDAQNMNSRSIENIAYMLTFYRTRLNLLTAQLKASSLSNMESFSVSPILSPFFKAQLSFLRFQPAAALKELSQAAANGASNGGAQNPMNATMYFNNLACVHFQMNKYSLSSFYLTRALQENDKANAAIGKQK